MWSTTPSCKVKNRVKGQRTPFSSLSFNEPQHHTWMVHHTVLPVMKQLYETLSEPTHDNSCFTWVRVPNPNYLLRVSKKIIHERHWAGCFGNVETQHIMQNLVTSWWASINNKVVNLGISQPPGRSRAVSGPEDGEWKSPNTNDKQQLEKSGAWESGSQYHSFK